MNLKKQILKNDIDSIKEIYNIIDPEEELTISAGFDSCIIGVTASHPRRIIYDFYKCVEVVMIEENEFDINQACDWVDNHLTIDVGEQTPIFIKPIYSGPITPLEL